MMTAVTVGAIKIGEPDFEAIVKGLTLAEQNILRPILERDSLFQNHEELRVEKMKRSVSESFYCDGFSVEEEYSGLSLFRKGSVLSLLSLQSLGSIVSSSSLMSVRSLTSRSCSTCETPLGFIVKAGQKCKKCSVLLCSGCQYHPRISLKNYVLCKDCYTHREYLAASNEWCFGQDVAILRTKSLSESFLSVLRMHATAEIQRKLSVSKALSETENRRKKMEAALTSLDMPPISASNLLRVPRKGSSCGGNNDKHLASESSTKMTSPIHAIIPTINIINDLNCKTVPEWDLSVCSHVGGV
uniref:FYVE-type domain-containing protein n=1 Tax=Rhabditophanes sp. KR3021 TaxID=114890 RepID=A0AC35TGU1_9BILA